MLPLHQWGGVRLPGIEPGCLLRVEQALCQLSYNRLELSTSWWYPMPESNRATAL